MAIDKLFDLNLLRTFAYIYMFRNITRAAEKLNLTQPAVSRALSKLNDIYGEKLFVRKSNEMIPTRLAEHISESVFMALKQTDNAMQIASRFDPDQHDLSIMLGMNDYCANVIFPEIYKLIQSSKSSISVHSLYCNYANVLTKIEALDIDGAVVSAMPQSSRVEGIALFTDDYVVISHPKLKIKSGIFPLDIYLKQQHVLVSYEGSNKGWVDAKLLEMGHSRQVSCTIHFFSLLPRLVLELNLIATIPRKMAKLLILHYDFAIHELPFASQVEHFHFVRPRYSVHASYNAYILETIMQASKNIL